MNKKIKMTMEQLHLLCWMWERKYTPHMTAGLPMVHNDEKTIQKYFRMFSKAMTGKMIDEPVRRAVFDELCKEKGWPEPRYVDHMGKANQGNSETPRTAFQAMTQIIQKTGMMVVTTSIPDDVERFIKLVKEHPKEAKCINAVFTFPEEWLDVSKILESDEL